MGYYLNRQPKTGEIVYVNYDRYKGFNIAPKIILNMMV